MKKLASFAGMFALLMVAGAGFLQARTFVIPHVLEVSGSIVNTNQTFDTTIYATYTGGLALPTNTTVPGGGGAQVDIYLFENQTGQPMLGPDNSPRCDPCTVNLSAADRKETIAFESLIQNSGGYGTNPNTGNPITTILGYAVLVVGGADADAVNMQAFVVNRQTSQFVLSVFGFNPQPLLAAGTTQ